MRAAAALSAAAWLLGASCGPKNLSVRSVPFPAGKPVFLDAGGEKARALPACPEPLRLVVLDFPWCSACADAWKAVRTASARIPPGSLRAFRVLFDRERLFAGRTPAEVAPLRPTPPADAGPIPVTTLYAIPASFREQFRVEQVPVVLLLDAEGRIAKRWGGSFPALAGDLVREINRLLVAPRPPSET